MRIAIEGGEGVGKSTLLNLMQTMFRSTVFAAEGKLPGHNRDWVFQQDAEIQTKIFAEERRDLNHDVYLKNQDSLVVTDRSIISNLVYQGLTMEVNTILDINKSVDPDFAMPDLVILLDVDPEFALNRMKANGRAMDDNDRKPLDFHREIRSRFLDICRYDELFGFEALVISNPHDLSQDDLVDLIKSEIPEKFWA